ncbi:MAG: glycosyltransferase [Planctomycetota bacterium]
MSGKDDPTISIVIGTYQRYAQIKRCIETIRQHVSVPYELVVIDGGSTDGSAEWLAEQPDVRLHLEQERAGCCRAYDLGFRMTTAPFVCWLNDDAYPLAGTIEHGLDIFARADMTDLGLLACYHTHTDHWNELDGFDHDGRRWGVLHVRGYPYANFGLLRRGLLAEVDFLDTGYKFCAWDPDLALKIQLNAGLKVLSSRRARVYHEEFHDERKASDAQETRQHDNERLFRKWKLPPKGQFPDPRPAYRELLGERGLL